MKNNTQVGGGPGGWGIKLVQARGGKVVAAEGGKKMVRRR